MGPYWGIDLGGTKIEGVILESFDSIEPICRIRLETEAERGYEHIQERIQLLVESMSKQTGLRPAKLGIGHPGAVEPSTGLLKNSNTVCMNGKPLIADLQRRLGIEICNANDANCFALAEARLGAARGSAVVFGVILGTGTGGGVVVNGRVLNGRQGIGGEWGHNVLDPESTEECYCGKRGCVEMILAGPKLEKFYSEQSGTKRKLREIHARAASGEDSHAVATIDRLCAKFGQAISVVINILDPDTIVLGGGVSNIPELYTRGVESIRDWIFNERRVETAIVKHRLGDSAGVFGAALLTAEGGV